MSSSRSSSVLMLAILSGKTSLWALGKAHGDRAVCKCRCINNGAALEVRNSLAVTGWMKKNQYRRRKAEWDQQIVYATLPRQYRFAKYTSSCPYKAQKIGSTTSRGSWSSESWGKARRGCNFATSWLAPGVNANHPCLLWAYSRRQAPCKLTSQILRLPSWRREAIARRRPFPLGTVSFWVELLCLQFHSPSEAGLAPLLLWTWVLLSAPQFLSKIANTNCTQDAHMVKWDHTAKMQDAYGHFSLLSDGQSPSHLQARTLCSTRPSRVLNSDVVLILYLHFANHFATFDAPATLTRPKHETGKKSLDHFEF